MIAVEVIGVIVSIGSDVLKRIMISLYPIQKPKGNDRWLNTEDNTWYVWVGGEWVVDAWERGE